MMRGAFPLTLAAAIFLASVSAFSQTMPADLFGLNRGIVTARYYYYEKADYAAYAEALSNLRTLWQGFRDSYEATNAFYPDWQQDVRKIDYLSYQTITSLSPAKRTNSIRCLNEMETMTRNIRASADVPHFFDLLLEFREPLDELIYMTPTLTTNEEALLRVKNLSSDLIGIWERLQNYEIDETSLQLESDELERFGVMIDTVTMEILRLKKAIIEANVVNIRVATANMKKAYYSLYYSFGKY